MFDLSAPDLVARAQAGDSEALGALYDQYHLSIFRYMWARSGDKQLAEDLTGEVFVRMLAHLSSYRMQGLSLQSWLFRIAHNLLVDNYRKTRGRVLVALEEVELQAGAEACPTQQLDHTLTVEQMQKALAGLAPSQREVVVLRFFNELSVAETAQVLNKTEAAVKAQQHRGLVALRRQLNREPERTIE